MLVGTKQPRESLRIREGESGTSVGATRLRKVMSREDETGGNSGGNYET
jgi:hypothetical protein